MFSVGFFWVFLQLMVLLYHKLVIFPSLFRLVSMVLSLLLCCCSFLALAELDAGMLCVTPELQPPRARGSVGFTEAGSDNR